MPAFVNPDTVYRGTTGSVVPTSWATLLNDDLNALYGDAGWAIAAMASPWASVNSTTIPSFKKTGTRVWLRGQMSGGSLNTTAFTLPVGYRPSTIVYLPVFANGAFAVITIPQTGTVSVFAGSVASYVTLDSVSFDTV